MSLVFKGVETRSWHDYVESRFADTSLFSIEKNGNDRTIHSKGSNTKIWFGINDNGSLLHDCQYYSLDCKGWSGETTGANPNKFGEFSLENLQAVDGILEIPITKGWISVDYYLFGKHWKSVSFEGLEKGKHAFVHYTFGCGMIILFPLTILVDVLMKIGLVGKKLEFKIKPIMNR